MSQVILVQEEPISCFEMVETLVKVTDAGSFSINVIDNQQLRSDEETTIVVKAIRVTVPGKLAFGPISGLPCAPVTELQKISLTLYCQGWQRGHNMPILNLNDVQVPGGTEPFRYHTTKFNDWIRVDLPKSYFLYSNGSGGVAPGATGYCLMLEFEYVRMIRVEVRTGVFEWRVVDGPNP